MTPNTGFIKPKTAILDGGLYFKSKDQSVYATAEIQAIYNKRNIGFAGVVLVNLGGAGLDMSFHWNGEFFILISTVSAACSSAFIKKFSTKANPVLLSGWQFMMGGTVLIIMGKLMGGKFQFEGIAPMFLL